MLLIALLLFCKVIDDMYLKNLRENPELHEKIMDDMLHVEEALKQGKIFEANTATLPDEETSGRLPPLVPLEFPPDFYQKQGKRIIEAVEAKMGKFFGTSNVNKLKNFDSAEGMLEYVKNMDFNNSVVNFIVHKCIEYMKPADNLLIKGITDKKECKKTCKQSLSTSIAFAHRIFQSMISQATDEDIRFRIYQDPKKCYEYSFDKEQNKHSCKCVDKGHQVKVSPRLLEIINNKLFNPQGTDFATQLENEEPTENLESIGSFLSLRKMGNVLSYFSGLSSSSKSRWYGGGYNGGYGGYGGQDSTDFWTKQLIINILIFFFCHCLWYFHLAYLILIILF
ncbi:uncharacterized protein LOC135848436 [Planococcus citri]|uniref:uncharacterized protein LOC135848436 n=1 Tax=Planococcus citri TaxID=170843 RepID=UPI0031F80182